MLSYPTIHVENFARIRNADIEIAPLTLFVGDNNSGKTYLSSLIWGIDGFLDGMFSIEQNYGQEFQNFLDWIKDSCSEIKEEGSVSYAVSEQFHKAIVGFINQHLSVRKEDCVSKIFGSNVGIKHLALDVPFDCTKNVSFGIRRINRESTDANLPLFIADIHINGKPPLFSQYHRLRLHSNKYVLRTLIRLYYQNIWKSAVYIPASRAGLLLTRRSVLDDSLESRFPRHKIRNKDYQLTQPQVEFVRLLLWLSKEQRRKMLCVPLNYQAMSKIVDFIEYRILNGRIDLSEAPVADILYYPQNSKEPLTMQLVSGVVSEIAPFLSCLKFGNVHSCIFEEPELSLHPELQHRIAQVLIRLSHQIGVLATTHSTIIAQHINNMIKLFNHKQEGEELAKEKGYEKEDIINPETVRMYQFSVDADNMTTIEKLKCGVNGFPVSTFGKSIRKMRDEIWDFQIATE